MFLQLRKSVALALPLIIVWIAIACAVLCSAHKEERQDKPEISSLSDSMDSCGHDDCCAIQNVAPSLLPERRIVTKPAKDQQQASALPTLPMISITLCSDYGPSPSSSADPPFERLRVLRI